jgi:nicotinamidase-related amidase
MNTPKEIPIYRTVGEMAAKDHTALVVWDVQNGLVNMAFNKDEFLGNLKSLISAARAQGIPVIYTKITPLPLDLESPFRLFMSMKRFGADDPKKLPPFMRPGSPEAEIHAEVQPRPEDLVLNKHTYSIFMGTPFEYLMRNRGVESLLFSGIATEMGIDSSARDAVNRGFYTIVVSDCVSSPDKEAHGASLKNLQKICLVAPSKDVVGCWA